MPRRGCVSAEKVFASLPQVERGVSKIIGGDPVGNTFIYTNGKCVIIRNINVSTPFPPSPTGSRFRPCAVLGLTLPHPPVLLRPCGLGRGRTPYTLQPNDHSLAAQEDRFRFIQARFYS